MLWYYKLVDAFEMDLVEVIKQLGYKPKNKRETLHSLV